MVLTTFFGLPGPRLTGCSAVSEGVDALEDEEVDEEFEAAALEDDAVGEEVDECLGPIVPLTNDVVFNAAVVIAFGAPAAAAVEDAVAAGNAAAGTGFVRVAPIFVGVICVSFFDGFESGRVKVNVESFEAAFDVAADDATDDLPSGCAPDASVTLLPFLSRMLLLSVLSRLASSFFSPGLDLSLSVGSSMSP